MSFVGAAAPKPIGKLPKELKSFWSKVGKVPPNGVNVQKRQFEQHVTEVSYSQPVRAFRRDNRSNVCMHCRDRCVCNPLIVVFATLLRLDRRVEWSSGAAFLAMYEVLPPFFFP